MQPSNQTIRIDMIHIFVIQHNVGFGDAVIRDIVINNKLHQSTQQGQFEFVVQFIECRLHHDGTFALRSLPNICEIVDSLTPFVNE